ncbi:MAG: hypothetical protein QNL33_04010 [Akkermansiaceae bacterium]
MKVMICWTDLPYQTASTGTPSSEVQDPEANTADNPMSPAIPGYETVDENGQPEVIDNTADNVEQVIIPTPQVGNYTVRISHKGDLKAMTQPSPGIFHLSFNQNQAVSTCVTGNKDPDPRLPRLRVESIAEIQFIGMPYYEIRPRESGAHARSRSSV